MDFEAAWCPVCSRQIEPKRYQVPIHPPQPPTPAPPPSSPQSSPTKKANGRKLAARTRGGLVQGTGRMKPNGTIKRADSTTSTKSPQTSQQLPKPAPIKYRTVIDQAPLPLYCSDECKRQDDEASSGSSAESSGSSSIPLSESSISTVSSAPCEQPQPEPVPQVQPRYTSPSVAVIAKIYNFPPPPPPAPIAFEDAMVTDSYYPPTCENGIIMAGRYIQERCAKPAKPQTGPHKTIPEPIKQVPGWNDGTNTWRSCVYSMSSAPAAPQVKHKRAFGSFVSPRSQLGDASMPLRSASSSSVPSNATMINKFTDSLKTRATSPSSDATLPKRERSLLPPGVEGKLLVPDVKLKVRTGSSASLGSRVRSPLSATSESGDDESTQCESPRSSMNSPKRPVPETRSWSYDKFKTYDIMPFPTTKEKRTQVQVVDGKEVRVEVEVAVQAPIKRLFLFPASIRASS